MLARIRRYWADFLSLPYTDKALLILVMTLPFEIVFGRAAYHLFDPILGGAHIIFHPVNGLVFLLLCRQWTTLRNGDLIIIGLLLLASLGYLASALYNGSSLALAARLSWLTLTGVASGFLVLRESDRLRKILIQGFFVSFSVWCLIDLVLYFRLVQQVWDLIPETRDYSLSEMLIHTRAPGHGVPERRDVFFFRFSNNVNKLANNLVTMLFLLLLLGDGFRKSWRSFAFMVMPVSILLMLVFSRGALAVSFAAGLIIVGISYITRNQVFQTFDSRKVLLAFCLPLVLTMTTSKLRDYWRDPSTMLVRQEILVELKNETLVPSKKKTMVQARKRRIAKSNQQKPRGWEKRANDHENVRRQVLGEAPGGKLNELSENESDNEEELIGWDKSENSFLTEYAEYLDRFFGMGPGQYGLQRVGSVDFGTHNFFVDSWLDGGVISLLAFAMLFLLPLLRNSYRLRLRLDWVGLVSCLAIVSIAALCLREHNMVFLYSFCLSGFMFGLLLNISFSRASASPEKGREGIFGATAPEMSMKDV